MNRPGEHPPGEAGNTLPVRAWSWLLMLLAATIGSTALLAFGIFLYTGPWQVVVLFTDTGTGTALAFDALLSLTFFAQHSGMIRRSFKTWSGRYVPSHYHGAIFTIASGICLYSIVHLWQVTEHAIMIVDGTARLGLRAVFLLAVGGIIGSALALHSFDSFGLRAIKSRQRGEAPPDAAFTVRGPYRWVRHPQYLCALVMIWSYPDLTADRLLFNVLWSVWIVIGALLEERDLVETFGREYRDYQSRVPMLIPLPVLRR